LAKRNVRSDLLAVAADLPKADRPAQVSLENITEALAQAFGADDAVRAVVRGGVKPSVTWVLGGHQFLRVEESIFGKWTAVVLPLSEIGELVMEPAGATGGWLLYLMAPDGSEILDRLKVATREAATWFGEARRRQTKAVLFEVVSQLSFDCFHPLSDLQGASAASDLQMGANYEVAFSATAVVIGDHFGPVLMFPEADLLELEITGREDVRHESEFETILLLRTAVASIVLVNRHVLPQEARANLLPETQRIAQRRGSHQAAASAGSASSLADELHKLAALRDAGHLDEAEYAVAKRRLLETSA